jgi:DNA-binding transcriptional regulator of glucitol operon
MAKWLLEDIDINIDHNQYGNRKGVATTHYLLKLMDTLHMNADRPGHASTVVITDFSKAFDLVDHNILMQKFISMGVRPSVVTWIASFLDGRQQCVRYRGCTSEWKQLNGGVPQGTKVGPLGFVVIVNDAAIDTPFVTLKYVDDLTLVESRSRSQSSVMQQHLDNFECWAAQNNMKLNPKKCATMKVSFLKNDQSEPPLTISNVPLQDVEVTKILGVYVSANLKWDKQVTEILKKANGRLYMLKLLKCFNLPHDDLVTVFAGFVRPLAEYAAPIWHSGLTVDQCAALERIQKRACKIIMGKEYASYDQALLDCGLDSLSQRRDQLCFKFLSPL